MTIDAFAALGDNDDSIISGQIYEDVVDNANHVIAQQAVLSLPSRDAIAQKTSLSPSFAPEPDTTNVPM